MTSAALSRLVFCGTPCAISDRPTSTNVLFLAFPTFIGTVLRLAIQHPHILVFDSGVGGLSVAHQIRRALPQTRLTYISDNRCFPYGEKTSDFLVHRVIAVMENVLSRIVPDVVVIACNTASTITLPRLRERFAVPFVGVVPAIKPAVALSQTKTVGVLATPATIERPYTLDLIREHALGCKVLLQGSSVLVGLAENKLMGRPLEMELLTRELRQLTERSEAASMDTLVLACTHFPLLKAELAEAALPRRFAWVDSGEAIARRVGFLLSQQALELQPYEGAHSFLVTAALDSWETLSAALYVHLATQQPTTLEVVDV